jgi:hypothetical protein
MRDGETVGHDVLLMDYSFALDRQFTHFARSGLPFVPTL